MFPHCSRPHPLPGEVYKHFKGGTYKIIGVAHRTDTSNTYMVVYSPQDNPETLWVRPLVEFMGKVHQFSKSMWRFERVVTSGD